MPELARIKTRETSASVEDFLTGIKDETKRKDSFTLVRLMKRATKETPKIWGSSIIGFGNRIYTSPSTKRQVEWFRIGFSPRKDNISLYLVMDISKYAAELKKLGKHKTGMGCLYIKKLADVDMKVLESMIQSAAKQTT